MPVLIPDGAGIVAKRSSDGSAVIATVPSLAPGTAISMPSDSLAVTKEHMANEQKFSALTGNECSSQGFGLSALASSTGNVEDREASFSSRSCQTCSLLSRPCLRSGQCEVLIDEKPANGRDNSFASPGTKPDDAPAMSSPDRYRPFLDDTPVYQPSFGVAREEPKIAAMEFEGVDL